jgi:hypothetical protein
MKLNMLKTVYNFILKVLMVVIIFSVPHFVFAGFNLALVGFGGKIISVDECGQRSKKINQRWR